MERDVTWPRIMTRRGSHAMGAAAAVVLWLSIGARADAPRGQYTDLGDGTVRDNLTGLVWQQAVDARPQKYANARLYCLDLTLGGSSVWRHPSVLELQSIVDETLWNPSIDPTFFPGTRATQFWSASSVAGFPGYAWSVDFVYGEARDVDVSASHHARGVR